MIFGAICLRTLSRFHASWKPLSELMAYLKIALEALDVIGGYSAIVRRCSKYLKKMIQVVALLGRRGFDAICTSFADVFIKYATKHPPKRQMWMVPQRSIFCRMRIFQPRQVKTRIPHYKLTSDNCCLMKIFHSWTSGPMLLNSQTSNR